MNENNDSLLVAEYALGLLDATEATAFEQRLDNEPALRSELTEWSEQFVSLYDDVEEVAPPSTLKANIEDRLFATTQTDTASSESTKSSWSWPLSWLSGLVFASLIGLIVYESQQTGFQAEYTASLETADSSLVVVASYDKTHNLLQVASTKNTPASGRSHELWLIAGNNPPVSLGVLSALNNENIVLSKDLASMIVGSTLAISDEPQGGSPTGSPTGDVLTTAVVIQI